VLFATLKIYQVAPEQQAAKKRSPISGSAT